MYDIFKILMGELANLARHQPLVAVIYPHNVVSQALAYLEYSAKGGVHARRVAAACQNCNGFHKLRLLWHHGGMPPLSNLLANSK